LISFEVQSRDNHARTMVWRGEAHGRALTAEVEIRGPAGPAERYIFRGKLR
jgi:hypothetical protein